MAAECVDDDPVDYTKTISGNYRLYVASVKDMEKNQDGWTFAWGEKPPKADFKVEDEFDYAFEYGIDNPSLSNAVSDLQDGMTGRVLLNSGNNLLVNC